ncbi:MAG: transcription antitermination factor NusB [Calditrichia bacterium]
MLSRRQARRFALQVLFSNEFLHEDVLSVARRVALTVEFEMNDFCRDLITRTSDNKDELDKLILANLKDKDIERVALLDKVLIRLATCELLFFPDIPAEVTINEALELSKEFISNRSSRFINGIIDAIYKELKSNDQLKKSLLARLSVKNMAGKNNSRNSKNSDKPKI